MRATILYGFVGLIGISALPGCGLIQGWRGDGCENGTGAGGARRVYTAPDPPAPIAPPTVLPKVVVINENPGAGEAPPIATARSTPAPSVRPLPVPDRNQTIEPLPIRVDLSAQPPAGHAVQASVPAGDAAPQKTPASAVTSVAVPKERTEKFWTVIGTVEAFRNTWRVRYAAIDHDDRYGGVVVLDGGAELNPLRDGMMVRVRGTLAPSTERTGSAHFRVHDVQVLD